MKKKKKSIILSSTILVLLILIAACSSRPTEYVGMVNDRYITLEEYMISTRNQFESYVLNTGLTPDEAGWKEINDRAFNNLVEGIIFQEQLRKHNISITQSEVLDTLITNIPTLILESRQFTDNGVFNRQKYLDSLRSNDPIDLSWLIRYYSDIYVPLAKLKEKVISNQEVIDKELNNEYVVLNSSADLSIIAFHAEDFDDIVIYDREIRDHYNTYRTDFMNDPYARIEYVIFPVKPSSLDSLYTKTKIDSIYAELQDDKPFPILAGALSDSQTSINRGEMPFLELETFPARIRNDIASLELDQFTRPYAVTDGWVIYQMMARTRNMVKLREIFVKHKASQRTRDLLYDRIINIRELATEIGLEQTAYEYDLDLHKSGIITLEDPYIPLLGKSDNLILRAVNTEAGTIYEPIYHNMLQSYVLVSVTESQSRSYKQLHVVYDQIQDILYQRRQQELATLKADEFYRSFNYNRILNEAEKAEYHIYHFDAFNANSYFAEVDPTILVRSFFIPGKEKYVAPPVVIDSTVYIGVIHRLNRANPRDMTPAVRRQIREQILRERGDELFSQWLRDQKNNARIRDWRNRM